MAKDSSVRGTGARDQRRDRLAQALRDNLKRRKAQGRDRNGPAGPGDGAPSDEDTSAGLVRGPET
ncbi:hypothetical protein ACUN0C_01100 [Faunimonas sp. B44]|uniref:hypothetical protein n=1 Tax=Faunimonas sp. B44 TaxID=3461493 RepID=UPI00404461E5